MFVEEAKKLQPIPQWAIACYEKLYPELDREPIKRVGGKGDFGIPSTYFANEQYFVGEAGGFKTSCGFWDAICCDQWSHGRKLSAKWYKL